MPALTAKKSLINRDCGLQGTITVAGDKSISHRAVILSALSMGTSQIDGLLEADDVLATIATFRALGVHIERKQKGCWQIDGVGLGALKEAETILDMGNSGTAMRLMMGVLAGQSMRSFLSGDQSLNGRPMRRIADPLQDMGAIIHCRAGNYPPLLVEGSNHLLPLRYEMKVASAQIKSALILAAMQAHGVSEIIEPTPCRDHTERMIIGRGGKLEKIPLQDENNSVQGYRIRIHGGYPLSAIDCSVPSDPSSAAFMMVAALIIPNSEITLLNVGLNPTRTGLITALQRMGAKIETSNQREVGGEPIGDLYIHHTPLQAVKLEAALAPSMIDEYPIMAVAAALANGTSRFEGLSELRIKESDRLQAIVDGLQINGITCRSGEDWLEVEGCGIDGLIKGEGTVKTHHDHRIAMSFLILGLAAQNPIMIDDDAAIRTSFPDFTEVMEKLGAQFISS